VAKIKKGDTVEVITGEHIKSRGVVQRVVKGDRVVVSGVNLVKKHQKPRPGGRGQVHPGIIEFEAPIHVSNVMLVCPKCNERTRVGFRVGEGGKTRICIKCQAELD